VAFAHPQVEAVLLWGFWARRHWLGPQAALVGADWQPLPAWRRLAALRQSWRTDCEAVTDAAGVLRFRGFYGTYEVIFSRPGARGLQAVVRLTRPGGAEAVLKPS
jgi:hypothetical protein